MKVSIIKKRLMHLEENIPASFGIVVFIAIVGAVFFNLLAIVHAVKPESIVAAVNQLDVPDMLKSRLEDSEFYQEDMQAQLDEFARSAEIQELITQYAQYLYNYMIKSTDSGNITQEDVAQAITPHLKQWLSGDLSDQQLQAQAEQFIQQTKLMSVFASATSYFPGKTSQRIQSVVNSNIRMICVLLMLVLFGLLFVTALPQKYACFCGLALISIGIFSYLLSALAIFLFNVLFSNKLLFALIAKYERLIGDIQSILLIIGGIIFLLGAALIVLNKIRENERLGQP